MGNLPACSPRNSAEQHAAYLDGPRRNSLGMRVWVLSLFISSRPAKQASRATLDVVRRALESAGVELIDENGGGPGVRLRKRQNRKD